MDLEFYKIRVLHLRCPECSQIIHFSGDFSRDKIKCHNTRTKHENRKFSVMDNIERISITYDVVERD